MDIKSHMYYYRVKTQKRNLCKMKLILYKFDIKHYNSHKLHQLLFNLNYIDYHKLVQRSAHFPNSMKDRNQHYHYKLHSLNYMVHNCFQFILLYQKHIKQHMYLTKYLRNYSMSMRHSLI